MLHDGFGDDIHRYFHVFVTAHGSVQIEILDVGNEHFGVGCGKDAIDQELGGDHAAGFGVDLAWVVNAITSHGGSDSFLFRLLGPVSRDKAQVRGLSAGRDTGVGNEVNGFSALGHVGEISLGETTEFVGAALFPFFAFRAGAKSFVFGGFAGVGMGSLEC